MPHFRRQLQPDGQALGLDQRFRLVRLFGRAQLLRAFQHAVQSLRVNPRLGIVNHEFDVPRHVLETVLLHRRRGVGEGAQIRGDLLLRRADSRRDMRRIPVLKTFGVVAGELVSHDVAVFDDVRAGAEQLLFLVDGGEDFPIAPGPLAAGLRAGVGRVVRGGLVVFIPHSASEKRRRRVDDAMPPVDPEHTLATIAGGQIDVALKAVDVELREPH